MLAGASATVAQQLPMTREGLDSAVAQYFAGADRNGDGRLDRAETADALGLARSLLTARRDIEPFLLEETPDGRVRLSLNANGPLSQGGVVDLLYRAADRDSDGTLSLAEVRAVARARFDAVDRDHDGILDEKERAAAEEQLNAAQWLLGRVS
jgi:hypothetical protein